MPRSAAQVMQLALSDANDRRAVLQLLTRSSQRAQTIAPSAWAVRLSDWGFRLYVGQVETLSLFDEKVWLLLAATPQNPKLIDLPVMATNFKCWRGPRSVFIGSIDQFNSARKIIEPFHTAFIDTAARGTGRKPRKGTPFARYHSQEMMEYAATETSSSRAALFASSTDHSRVLTNGTWSERLCQA